MKPRILYLIVGIPAAAVVMGMITLYLAFSHPDQSIVVERPALSKTSWQTEE